jgi:hypothetical protein
MGWDTFQKFFIPWDGMGRDYPIPRGALIQSFLPTVTSEFSCHYDVKVDAEHFMY